MQRFFCKICKRVRRVRTLPPDVEFSEDPTERIGECSWHSRPKGESHGHYVRRHRVLAPPAPPSKYQRKPKAPVQRPVSSLKKSKERRGKQDEFAA